MYTGRLEDQVWWTPPIVTGLLLAGAGVLGMVLVDGYVLRILFSVLSGVGMALHEPNLISAVTDAACAAISGTTGGSTRPSLSSQQLLLRFQSTPSYHPHVF